MPMLKKLKYIGLLCCLFICTIGLQAAQDINNVGDIRASEFFVTFLQNSSSNTTSSLPQLQLQITAFEEDEIIVEYFKSTDVISIPLQKDETKTVDIDAKKAYYDIISQKDIQDIGIRVFSKNQKEFSVFAINKFGTDQLNSYDVTLIYPKEALGREYITSNAELDKSATEFVVMAAEEGTTRVTIRLATGGEESIDLKYKQVYMVRAETVDDPSINTNLSGSIICADKRVAVFSGNQEAIIPKGMTGLTGNYTCAQMTPINNFGHKYIVPLTGGYTKQNEVHLIAPKSTTARVTFNGTTTYYPLAAQRDSVIQVKTTANNALNKNILYIESDEMLQVCLFTTSGLVNYYIDETTGELNLYGSPSMINIPSLEHTKGKASASFFNAGDTQLDYLLNIWAKGSDMDDITLDGEPVTGIEGATFANFSAGGVNYKVGRVPFTKHGMLQAGETGTFGGYISAMGDAAGYLSPLLSPVLYDSLLLADNADALLWEYNPDPAEWDSINTGWYVNSALVDSLCNGVQLDFSLKAHNKWDSIQWKIVGTEQPEFYDGGMLDAKNPQNLKLSHEFTLKKDKSYPVEVFDIIAYLYSNNYSNACDDKIWDAPIDSIHTYARVFRTFNDTVWKVLCSNDTCMFFSDTTETGERYSTVFYNQEDNKVPGLEDKVLYNLDKGEKIIINEYKSSIGNCDSISTLRIYVCDSWDFSIDTTVCASEIGHVNAALGDYFTTRTKNRKATNFEESYAKRATDSRWTKLDDGSWEFNDSSTLVSMSCLPDIYEYLSHGASYGGCDSTLHFKMRVVPTEWREMYKDYELVYCDNKYDWYWTDEATGESTFVETIRRTNDMIDKVHPDTVWIPYKNCHNCPDGGCDSIIYTINIRFINKEEGATETIHVCQGGTGRHSHTEPGDHTKNWEFDANDNGNKPGSYPQQPEFFAKPNSEGCEYSYTVIFVIDSIYDIRDTVVECFDPADIKTFTWTDASGKEHENYDLTTPNGHSSYWTGPVTLDPSGTYTFIERNTSTIGAHCDSTITHVIELLPYHETLEEDAPIKNMANDEYYIWANTVLKGDHFTGTIDNPNDYPVEEYTNGLHLIKKTLQTYPFKGHSCDSIERLWLNVGSPFRDTIYDIICANSTEYEWMVKNGDGDEVLLTTLNADTLPAEDEVKEYKVQLQTTSPVPGLDSLYVLYLKGAKSYSFDETDETCQSHDGFTWRTLFIGSDTTETDGVYVIADHLTTNPQTVTHPTTGEVRSTTCDSIFQLTLTVHPTYHEDFYKIDLPADMKSNETLELFENPKMLFVGYDYDYDSHGTSFADLENEYGDGNVVEISESETIDDYFYYTQNGTSIHGCDSLTYAEIHICKLIELNVSASIGDNDTEWSFGGDTQPDDQGIRQHTLPLVTGSDFHVDDYTDSQREIREYTLTDTLVSSNKCDSIVHMTLHVFPTYRFKEDTTVCTNQDFNWWRAYEYPEGSDERDRFMELNHTRSGLVYDSLKTHLGYDSVYILNLKIFGTAEIIFRPSICINDTLEDIDGFDLLGGRIYWYGRDMEQELIVHYDKQNPVYGETGCDSTIHIYTTFNPAYGYEGDPNHDQWIDTRATCQHSGDYHWLDANGKEHLDHLYDQYGNPITAIPTDSAGTFIYYDSLKTVGCGCDSVHTLKLFVDVAYKFETDTAVCAGETFNWLDQNGDILRSYTFSEDQFGDFNDTISYSTESGDCDSSYYLHAYVDKAYEYTQHYVKCSVDSVFKWTGDGGEKDYSDLIADAINWTTPKTYTDVLHTHTTLGHCDSIVHLDLLIAPGKDSVWKDTVCVGEILYLTFEDTVYTFNGPGEYAVKHPNPWGCELTYRLTLEQVPLTKYQLELEPICMEKDKQDNYYTLWYTFDNEYYPITYSILYDSVAHKQRFEDRIDQSLPKTNKNPGEAYSIKIPVPKPTNDRPYPTPGFYTAEVRFTNGVCLYDSLMTFPLDVQMNYPAWIIEEVDKNFLGLLNEAHNGGYIWSTYQWFHNNELVEGANDPFFFSPTGFTNGDSYYVVLTREGESEAYESCPLYIGGMQDVIYVSADAPEVAPTCVTGAHPYTYIRYNQNGRYRIITGTGRLLYEGAFGSEDATAVELPATNGLYIIQVWSEDASNRAYRAVKIIVRDQCDGCN